MKRIKMYPVVRKTGDTEPNRARRKSNSTAVRNSIESPGDRVLRLHRGLGNQVVQRLISAGHIMAKLMIGARNDPQEREADQVADRVMQMPEPDLQRQAEPEDEEEALQAKGLSEANVSIVQKQKIDEDEQVQRLTEPEEDEEVQAQEAEEEEEPIQSENSGGSIRPSTSDFGDRLQSLKGGGEPLPESVRIPFENRLGHDFSGVRTHSGAEASGLAKSINAKAFTRGNDIVFGAGQYSPQTGQGKRLIAHELTHTIQQQSVHRSQGIQKTEMVFLQRTPGPREDLQKKYTVTIEKGDKDWSVSDLQDIKWVLEKLSKKESNVLKNYKFIRWSNKETRAKLDPTYVDPGVDECGLHEADINKGNYKISFYDKCFKDPEATSETMAGVPIERFNLLHEIGHAMDVAELRKKAEVYYMANDAYNSAIDEYNKASAKDQVKLKVKVEKLDAAEKKAKAEWEIAKTRSKNEFEALIKGKTALTEYSKTNTMEAFAEAFALYKIDPKGLNKVNPALAKWFEKHGHLNPVK